MPSEATAARWRVSLVGAAKVSHVPPPTPRLAVRARRQAGRWKGSTPGASCVQAEQKAGLCTSTLPELKDYCWLLPTGQKFPGTRLLPGMQLAPSLAPRYVTVLTPRPSGVTSHGWAGLRAVVHQAGPIRTDWPAVASVYAFKHWPKPWKWACGSAAGAPEEQGAVPPSHAQVGSTLSRRADPSLDGRSHHG